MRKKFLNRINILLGVISLTLAGCHSKQAVVAEQEDVRPALKYGVPPEVVALYAAPSPVIEEVQDTTVRPKEPEVLCKYGGPMPNWDR